MKLDLRSLVGDSIAVLAGVERGMAARKDFGLDALDDGDEDVVIVAPSNLDAISPSFVQGFFSTSFKKLGEEGLKAKYRLELDADLVDDVWDGVRRLKMDRSIAGHSIG